jgi:hypothetical protein
MKDSTYNTRLERNLAHFEILLGRLERLTGSLSGDILAHPQGFPQPPVDEEAQILADEYLETRRTEIDEQLSNLGEPE